MIEDMEDLSDAAMPEPLQYMETIKDADVDPAFLEKLPLAFLKKNLVFPLKTEDGALTVAAAGAGGAFALDDISALYSVPVRLVLAPEDQILDAVNRFYGRLSGSAQEVVNELNGESLESFTHQWEEPKDLIDLADEAPMIKLLNSLLFQAVKERASDIHIEPYERHVEVRFRRDGILYSILSPPKVVQEALSSRVKIMAGLDIAEKRLPQDGRIRLLVAGKDVDVRVSIVPTAFGERIVLRLLERKGGVVGLAGIGLAPQDIASIEALLLRNNGMILSTGPTGSGKTTTLYAALNKINSKERNIITIEDPIEYQLAGVGQIQVNAKVGLTFANGLRSMLRQDPDVIMVGEIRDMETAEMAVQASLTGHLVLSTLHTNDAPSAVARLIDMGVQGFLLSSSLVAVIAQRLVRVLCTHCKVDYAPEEGTALLFGGGAPKRLWRAEGCDKCLKTGYSGQTGIFEFMPVDNDLKSLMLRSPDSASIKAAVVKKGMRTLRNDGLLKAAAGMTNIEEVIRITHGD